MPFGLRQNKLIDISELEEHERGLKCNCKCPEYGENLVERLGSKNIRHFAHYSDLYDSIEDFTYSQVTGRVYSYWCTGYLTGI